MDKLASKVKELPVEMISEIFKNLENTTYYTLVEKEIVFHETFDDAVKHFTICFLTEYGRDYEIGTKKKKYQVKSTWI